MDLTIQGERTGGDSTSWLPYALPFVGALLLIAALYADMFHDWWGVWVEPGSFYAHAVFVPFFVAIMIWRNRARFQAMRWRPFWPGLLLCLPAMALLLLGKHAGITVVKSLSFVLLLVAGSILLAGPARTRILLFPLVFIIAMIPIFPDQLINVIAFPIQLKSTQIATGILNVLTLHARREGTLIQLDSYKMAVENACSGFRTLISLMTFSAAFAYLVEGTAWKRWLLFAVTLPLSLFINALRIASIGIVGELFSGKAAGLFHDYSGFLVLLLAFVFLYNLARALRCRSFLGVSLDDRSEAPTEGLEVAAGEHWRSRILAWRPSRAALRRMTPYVLAVDGLLACTLAVQSRFVLSVRPESPIATTQVPMALDADGVRWTAGRGLMLDRVPREVQDSLQNPSRVINRDYSGSDGSRIQFFMTAGNARWTFHDPHNCSLGSNAILHDVDIVSIPVRGGSLQVLECHFARNGNPEKYELMYCYVVEGKVLQRTDQVHKSIVWQTFFGDAGKQSYFLRFTQNAPGTDPEHRRQLMQFAGAMWERIHGVLLGREPAVREPPPRPSVAPAEENSADASERP